ncbi:hypothetical protein GEMRC1_007377 [Eukaryota sp. GEM-RC1]
MPSLHEGFLNKRDVSLTWDRKYFVIPSGSNVDFWDSAEAFQTPGANPNGSIVCKGLSVIVSPHETQQPFQFELRDMSNTHWILAADSAEDKDAWVAVFLSCGAHCQPEIDEQVADQPKVQDVNWPDLIKKMKTGKTAAEKLSLLETELSPLTNVILNQKDFFSIVAHFSKSDDRVAAIEILSRPVQSFDVPSVTSIMADVSNVDGKMEMFQACLPNLGYNLPWDCEAIYRMLQSQEYRNTARELVASIGMGKPTHSDPSIPTIELLYKGFVHSNLDKLNTLRSWVASVPNMKLTPAECTKIVNQFNTDEKMLEALALISNFMEPLNPQQLVALLTKFSGNSIKVIELCLPKLVYDLPWDCEQIFRYLRDSDQKTLAREMIASSRNPDQVNQSGSIPTNEMLLKAFAISAPINEKINILRSWLVSVPNPKLSPLEVTKIVNSFNFDDGRLQVLEECSNVSDSFTVVQMVALMNKISNAGNRSTALSSIAHKLVYESDSELEPLLKLFFGVEEKQSVRSMLESKVEEEKPLEQEAAPEPEVVQHAPQPQAIHQTAPEPEVVQHAPQPQAIHQTAPQPEVVQHAAPQPQVIHQTAPQPEVVQHAAPQPQVIHQTAPQPEVVQHAAPQPQVIHQTAPPLQFVDFNVADLMKKIKVVKTVPEKLEVLESELFSGMNINLTVKEAETITATFSNASDRLTAVETLSRHVPSFDVLTVTSLVSKMPDVDGKMKMLEACLPKLAYALPWDCEPIFKIFPADKKALARELIASVQTTFSVESSVPTNDMLIKASAVTVPDLERMNILRSWLASVSNPVFSPDELTKIIKNYKSDEQRLEVWRQISNFMESLTPLQLIALLKSFLSIPMTVFEECSSKLMFALPWVLEPIFKIFPADKKSFGKRSPCFY